MPMPFSCGWIHASVGETEITGISLANCKHDGGPAWEHDSVVAGLQNVFESSLSIRRKRKNRYRGNEDRPWDHCVDADAGSNAELDVAMSRPHASDALTKAAKKDGVAAETGERDGIAKEQGTSTWWDQDTNMLFHQYLSVVGDGEKERQSTCK